MDYGLGKTNTCGPNRLPGGLTALEQTVQHWSSAGVAIWAGGKSSLGYGAEEHHLLPLATLTSPKLLGSLLGEELEMIGIFEAFNL